jgi:hypothetical protein
MLGPWQLGWNLRADRYDGFGAAPCLLGLAVTSCAARPTAVGMGYNRAGTHGQLLFGVAAIKFAA